MTYIVETPLPGISRAEGAPCRIWLGQPELEIQVGGPPWQPVVLGAKSRALALLEGILGIELAPGALRSGPTFILLPEYALPKAEIPAARALIAAAPQNIVVVIGTSQLSGPEALAIDNLPPLWDGLASNRFTNCAILGVGGSDRLYLQPKRIPSEWELIRFWPGQRIRYFVGTNMSFAVQLCSDLLAQPESNAGRLTTWIRDTNRRLDAVLWIQHNEKPRSSAFTQSLAMYCGLPVPATVIAVASRRGRPGRMNNFAVSGAITSHRALSRHFYILDKEFHYFEPVDGFATGSRAVLLRYDADAHLVQSTFADSLVNASSIEKGTFFQDSQPYRMVGDHLEVSGEHFHIEDLCLNPAALACSQAPACAAAVQAFVASKIVPLSGRDFLAFLDLAMLPRPEAGHAGHPPGETHDHGDYNCHCWIHRRCLDALSEGGNEAAVALANVLTVIGALEHEGIALNPVYLASHRTYLETSTEGVVRYLAVVYPFALDAGLVEARLFPRRTAPLFDATYVVLGTQGRARPLVGSESAARVPPAGGAQAATAVPPLPRIVYQEDVNLALGQNRLANLILAR